MSVRQRSLVLDAYILVRLVLGRRVRELVLDHADHVVFFTSVVCYEDAYKCLPGILGSRRVDPAPAVALLTEFEPIIHAIDESTYAVARQEALARIEMRPLPRCRLHPS